ncbi:MAG: amino acid transporter [Peptococcaceae bacterium BRH_c4b]|nr:MAG: amino acid transporter [Peptococcaceae bacterium BRH_c4b]
MMIKLKKVLTLRTIVATSAGLTLASSSFVAAIQMAGFLAGDSAWIAIMVGGMLCLGAGACFSELNGMLPSAAGIRLYFGRAFGDTVALAVSLLYMFVVMCVVGAESYVLGNILSEALPVVAPVVWILFMFVVVTLMNIRGIRLAGNFQDMVTYGLMVSLIVLAFVGFYHTGFRFTTPVAPGGIVPVINAVAVGVFLYVGFEWVTPLAEEVTESRLIARGMLVAVGLLSIIYSLITMAMTSAVPREAIAGSPVPLLVFARYVLGEAGVLWAVVICLASSITTFNAGLISVSRFFYASARENVLPRVFSKISMRYFTPWVAILGVLAVALIVSMLVLITGRYLVLLNTAAAMESIVYAMSGAAVLVLRKKSPGLPRPYIVAGGAAVPVLTIAVFFLLALSVMAFDPVTAVSILAGLGISFWYVMKVVPVLKEKNSARRPAARRRPAPVSESQPEAIPAGTDTGSKPEKV